MAVNTQLIDTLAQVILAMSQEEQYLLEQKIQHLRQLTTIQPNLDQFFQELSTLEPDPNQLTLEEISQEVKAARHELWSGQ
jgi:CHASE3 domain sensor protein